MVTKTKIVRSFIDVNALYRQGVNLCKGCPFEHTASCDDSRLQVCNQRLKKYNSMMATTIQKRVSQTLKQQKSEYQKLLKGHIRDGKTVTSAAKSASKEYRAKFGNTPTARYRHALQQVKAAKRPAPKNKPPKPQTSLRPASSARRDVKKTGTGRQPIVPQHTPDVQKGYLATQMSPKELSAITGLPQKAILALDKCRGSNKDEREGISFVYIGNNLAIATDAHILAIVNQKSAKEQLVFCGGRQSRHISDILKFQRAVYPGITRALPKEDDLVLLKADADVGQWKKDMQTSITLKTEVHYEKGAFRQNYNPELIQKALRLIEALGWKSCDLYYQKSLRGAALLILKAPNVFVEIMPLVRND